MSNKSQRIVAHITPEFERKIQDVVEKYSLSKSEILRRGLVRELNELEGGTIAD